VTTACAQTCPANAITFGNLNDENSEIFRLIHKVEPYRIFEQLGVEPTVYYLSNRTGGIDEKRMKHHSDQHQSGISPHS